MLIIKFIFKLFFKLLIFLLVWVAVLLVAFNWPVKDKNESMEFGISFSNIFARDIGLDWKKAYVEILDELSPKKMRLAAYWTEIEKEPGKYDFSDLDFQLSEAEKRNVEVILAFGIKSPRWPECFIPDFYGGNPVEKENLQQVWNKSFEEMKNERETALLKYERELIERYKDRESIKIWQVENEPFLPFGHCVAGAIDANLLDKEIEQVKKIDSKRPVMVTDSGELSIWFNAARRADIFGTTLYRMIHKPPIGYITYPLGPMFFKIKAWPVRNFTDANDIVVSELQAEPWGPGWLPNLSVQEQYKSMNPEKFREIVEYAQKTGFSESYLWGAEWWYWLKQEKDQPQMWEEAKKVISPR